MFTAKAVAYSSIGLVVLVGSALAFNQAKESSRINQIEDQNRMRVVMPTVEVATPTASPSATIAPMKRVYVPVVTQVPTK